MASFAQRLTRAQANLPSPEQESIEHLTKENLKDEVMSFGKSHLGKTYEEMWVCHPDWIRWFTAHYHNSTKLEHRKMIHYIGLKIEESEANEAQSSQLPVPKAKAKSHPKSLAAKPKTMAGPSTQPVWNPEIDTEIYEMMSESPWVNETQTREEIQNIQERMTGLETAMQRMIALMSQGHMMQPQPVPSTLSETATAEWEDPWNP
jgi:hypothetical protein